MIGEHPVYTLEQLRERVAQLADLPGDTPVRRGGDDGNEPDSYQLIGDVEVVAWDGEICHWERPPADAVKALIVW